LPPCRSTNIFVDGGCSQVYNPCGSLWLSRYYITVDEFVAQQPRVEQSVGGSGELVPGVVRQPKEHRGTGGSSQQTATRISSHSPQCPT
jgi:hypothetical protein